MLVYGTCNPEGYGDENYEGLYLTEADIRNITPKMQGIPVKIEHRGTDVGTVVSAWMHEVCEEGIYFMDLELLPVTFGWCHTPGENGRTHGDTGHASRGRNGKGVYPKGHMPRPFPGI